MDQLVHKDKAIDLLNNWISKKLSCNNIDYSQNLINLGVQSLDVMELVSILRREGLKIKFSQLIKEPTLNQWIELIRSSKISKLNTVTDNTSKKQNEIPFELTDVQSAYLIGREDDQELGGIGCHAYFEFTGERLDINKLNYAWYEVQMRHPMLRAKFTQDGKQYFMQYPHKNEIKVVSLDSFNDENIQKQLKTYRENISHLKRDVTQGDVAGLTVFILPNNQMTVSIDIDLLVADILSISIIIKELSNIYNGTDSGNGEEYTFKDYIENIEIDDKTINESKKFWVDKVERLNINPIQLPILKKPADVKEVKVTRHSRKINKNLWNQIKDNAKSYNTTPSIVLLACYMIILEKYSNQEAFYVNVPLFDRNHRNVHVRDIVADFTNLLLVEHTPTADEKFLETLERVKETFIQNISHSEYSGVNVQRDISKQNGTYMNIAPVVFACNIDYELEDEVTRSVLGNMTYMISQTPGVWLDFQSYVKNDELLICWDKVDELFSDEMITSMLNDYYDLLTYLGEKLNWHEIGSVIPESQNTYNIQIMSPKEKLYDGFLKNFTKYPEKIALIDTNSKTKISYKELFNRAMVLGETLRISGINKGDYVGIVLPRGYHQIVSILAIQFVGAAYVPIGIHQPNDRRKKIYNQVGIDVIISNSKYINNNELNKDNLIVLDIEESDNGTLTEIVDISSEETAYVIMTSGSTGTPKGVEISHSNALNTILDINRKFNITSTDTLIMVSSIEFDLSVYDIFGILGCGGALILTSEDNYKDPTQWLSMIKEYGVTIWNSVPILFDMLVTHVEGKKEHLPLDIVLLSGDWIDLQLPNRFYSISNEQSQIIAMGGATEASIWSNYIKVPRIIPKHWNSIPYGSPLKGQLYKVVDKFGRECPKNVIGELHIGGMGVAQGYIGDAELTSSKFYRDRNNTKWYKTGDNGRIWEDGMIEFLGRVDNQIKVKGHRIETGEIEHALSQIDEIGKVKVIEANKSLAAFIIPNRNENRVEMLQVSNKTQQYLSIMNNLLNQYTFNLLKSNSTINKDDFIPFQEILTRLSVSEKYGKIVHGWLTKLVDDGYLEIKGDRYRCKMFGPKVVKSFEKQEPIENYIKKLEKYIPYIITNKIDPLDLFYKEEKNLSPTYLASLMPWQDIVIESLIKGISHFKKDNINILEYETKNVGVSNLIYQGLEQKVDNYDYLAITSISKDDYFEAHYGISLKSSISQIEHRKYDVILIINALHRSSDINQTLNNLKDKMKDDGQLIIVEPNISLFIEQFTVDILNAYVGEKTYKRTYDEWMNIFTIQELECKRVQHIGEDPIYSNIFYMTKCNINKSIIRQKLNQTLPQYMIPTNFTIINEFPLNQNGKIDNKQLANLIKKDDIKKHSLKTVKLNDIEGKILRIWESEFNKKISDIHTNFYKNGGDSLLATRIATEIEKEFKVNFTIKDAMTCTTIKLQAEKVAKMSRDTINRKQNEFKQDVENINKPFELTEVQYSYFIGRKKELSENNVSTHCYFEIDGENLNIENLENAWNFLIKKHGMMRAVITEEGMQKILKEVPYYTFNINDLRGQSGQMLEDNLMDIRRNLSHQVLNIFQWPIFNIDVSVITDEKIRIHISFDNMIFDGWSMFALLEQWNKLYFNESIDDQITDLSFRDYVLYLNQEKSNSRYEIDKSYWLKRILGFLKAPQIKNDAKFATQSNVFTRRSYYIEREDWQNIKTICKELQITPTTLLIGMYSEAIRLVSSNDNFSLNITQFNRIPVSPEINKVIGDFTTLTILEINNNYEEQLSKRFKKIQSQLMEDLEHDKYSGVEFQRAIRKYCEIDDYILMPFVFTSGLGINALNSSNQFGEIIYNISQTPQVWLDNQVIERDGGLDIYWDSVDSELGVDNLDTMFNYFVNTLLKISKDKSILFEKVQNNSYKENLCFETIGTVEKDDSDNVNEIKVNEVKEILSHIVNHDIVSSSSRFFEVGGDSLKAIALTNKIREAFDVELELAFIFSNPTIKDISTKIEELNNTIEEEGVI
ncbi:non-ribosomal peptide synthetase [Staphylococcus schleiferi]|uniref:non-ribosomal peptide synthetase n=1 Tax=Staphylococcus sp. 191 TaxID=2070016 RepID=UPI0013F43B53|nr:non-ribosomal peptide synthetase [Staphylococcus sp. 191]NHA37351.1 non-ribosomal peptide synthetase [Staphylococcus schleiferi]NHB71793.1 non-ribosomal peptide synthetase [Staphylococcus sp. 191]